VTAPAVITGPITPAVLTVPDLVGKPWQDDLLPRFNTTVRATADPKVAKGLVMSMSPTAGSRLIAGSAVTVVVSNGPAPEVEAKVPDGVKRPQLSEIFKRLVSQAMAKRP
jgi:beta-lactam-binding protein with PASTA domain